MIPMFDGDAAPIGQCPLCVLPVVYRLWAPDRLRRSEAWVKSGVSASVYSAGGGRGSVEAWYSAAHDVAKFFFQVSVRLMFMFSLVMSSSHSFDTVDRAVLDLVLGRAGLPVWFPKACFGYHAVL